MLRVDVMPITLTDYDRPAANARISRDNQEGEHIHNDCVVGVPIDNYNVICDIGLLAAERSD